VEVLAHDDHLTDTGLTPSGVRLVLDQVLEALVP